MFRVHGTSFLKQDTMRNEYLGFYPDVSSAEIKQINKQHFSRVDAYLHYDDGRISIRSKSEYNK